ncbi:leucine-rich repeat domain-containing protein [Aquimarina aggregata]|uniref:leucine-rich repeat domain-containing protein n=1 Tax=Aquimarina aggregata TaxID=1642818 RepID=UPI0024905923|nr:hypothetical protein [Aquimarina aggregata]
MSRRSYTYILIVTLAIFSNSCSTYTNFYSPTFSKIEQKKISKIHRLDLSNQNLKSLPESIKKIKDLRMLDISSNPELDLQQVFEQLAQYNTIEILILDSLSIEKLPESIKQLSKLKQLSLAYNPKIDLEYNFDLIAELPIEFLNLKGNELSKLPENIKTIPTIKDLNLSFNTIKTARNFELLGMLPNLYSLWLDHNQLDKLPPEISKVNQVRFLYIDHNRLQKFPKEMSKMKTWVIHAGYNEFTQLPKVFTTMKSLFMVHINNNKINTIPTVYEVEKYSLAGLILDNNPITEKEKIKAKKLFKGFFLLSFEQK